MNKVKNKHIKGSFKVALITEKLYGNQLLWCGQVLPSNEDHAARKVTSMNVDGYSERG